MDRVAWIGRKLILGFCGYEVVALLAQDRHPHAPPTLSYLCQRNRRRALAVVLVLDSWLLWHLFLEPVGLPQ